MLRYNEVIHALALLDRRLDRLKHISTFISADEYRDIYSLSHHWNSRISYLRNSIFKPEQVDIDTLERNKFPLKLFSTVPNHSIYDSVAAIPVEFQYITTKKNDVIVLRIDLGDNKYLVNVVEIDDNILSTLQILYEKNITSSSRKDKSYAFEKAYFEYIHKNSYYILSKKKNLYPGWKSIYDVFFDKYQVSIREYSETGRYLWQRDYILLDNRAMKDYKIYSLRSQWQDNNREDLSSIDTSNKYFNIGSLYVDENGNYWSSQDAYQKYCQFLNM